jgi:4-amino-4-deoxy-L-arabinose transferase-like glycosyltransferase
VGLWQARLVSVASALVARVALISGLAVAYGRRTALVGGALLTTNYVFVMWNRAALMESTMTAALVVSWAAYAGAERRPSWGALAGIAAVMAWFTKAASAFFVAAIVFEGLTALIEGGERRRAAIALALGLVGATVVMVVTLVIPYWQEYQFYNWQMSVIRKPDYTARAVMDRATWLPLVHDVFTRMWLPLVGAAALSLGAVTRWRTTRPSERLLVLWLVVGLVELIVHDSGNVRRYVMFIPALAAMAVAALDLDGTRRAVPIVRSAHAGVGRTRLLTAPLLLLFGYLIAASVLRPFFLEDIANGHFRVLVRVSAAVSVGLTVYLMWRGWSLANLVARAGASRALVGTAIAITMAGDVWSYGQWLAERDNQNYDASVALGRLLTPGTLVQGKLANGMALESGIRPLFVGNGFGNFEDRLRRSDARYILTYDVPRIGYESSDGSGLIQGILDHYPNARVIATFDVDETTGPDRAALIDKFPGAVLHARD